MIKNTSKMEHRNKMSKFLYCIRGLCLLHFRGGFDPHTPHRGLRSQALDALGLNLKSTGSRALMVYVSESGSGKSLPTQSENFMPKKYLFFTDDFKHQNYFWVLATFGGRMGIGESAGLSLQEVPHFYIYNEWITRIFS